MVQDPSKFDVLVMVRNLFKTPSRLQNKTLYFVTPIML